MLFDSHLHTEFSADSEMQAAEALAAAKAKGLGLVFTEHIDLDQPGPGDIDFTFDAKQYWQQYASLRGDSLRLGIEVGMREATAEASLEFVGQVPFDYVLGSLHFCEEQDLYYPDFFQGKEKAQAWHIYFSDMERMLRLHSWVDALGHIDYICRTAPYADSELDYGTFQQDIDAVLAACLETDTVLELNTRRLGEKRALKELVPIYKRYREMGGKYVTLGSDAHDAKAIGAHFAAAQDFAQSLDLQIVTFAEREIVRC